MILLQKENFRNLNGKNRSTNEEVAKIELIELKGLFKVGSPSNSGKRL